MEIADWPRALGFERCDALFRDNDIDAEIPRGSPRGRHSSHPRASVALSESASHGRPFFACCSQLSLPP